MPSLEHKKIVVIGAGLGGMAAAITCASKGAKVFLFEKNHQLGGKCNLLKQNGFTFDLGPSILILPQIFRNLFREANKNFDNYVQLIEPYIQWRGFFEDRGPIDILSSSDKTKTFLQSQFPSVGKHFDKFNRYAIDQFTLANLIFLDPGVDNFSKLILNTNFYKLLKLDIFRSMHDSVRSFFKEKHIQDIFEYFIKYVGSSAYNAPGFMNLLYGAQAQFGLWYVKGGIYNLVKAMHSLLEELKVSIQVETEISSITTDHKKVSGVITRDGSRFDADAIICNMEVIPAYKKLLPIILSKRIQNRLEPSCSGIVLHLGVDRIYSQLAHHNFFFSQNQKEHFRSVFEKYTLPDDPTIYLVAPSKSDPSLAPSGCEIIKILPHIPHLRHDHAYSKNDYENFTERVIDKLERMGLNDIRNHIVTKVFWTPREIEQNYYSNAGSIYGVVSDMKKNLAFKAPKQSQFYKNLFFTGGSVNPGGGMPMVTLSGYHAGKMAISYLLKNL